MACSFNEQVITIAANFSAIFIYSIVEYHLGKTGRRSLWALIFNLFRRKK
jgi:hypothetical protein